MEKPIVKIAVRSLVEFILRSGDINVSGVSAGPRMQEGTRVHRKLQKEAGEDYKPEVRLTYQKEYDSFTLVVDGIADGIITSEQGVTIDEIKTVTTPLEWVDENYNPLHWAQAKCYACIYALQCGLDRVDVRLTYYNIDTDEKKHITATHALPELEQFFFGLLANYRVWAEFSVRHKDDRDNTIKALSFPFETYRKGQRELAAAVYRTIKGQRKLFVQAPTGTGKTMSVLFPAIKAMGEGMGEKIFYLTAKTITAQVAVDAVLRMQEKGLDLKTVIITARDRVCPCETRACNPQDCPYAAGHFDRVNHAIIDILENETVITREVVERYSGKHRVCPFEYTLDVALWADCIICDYNYLFDPRAYLRRFFELGGDYTFLVDEAHNLVDRAREMFSAELSKKAFMACRRELKGIALGVYKALLKINKYFIKLRKSLDEKEETAVVELPVELYPCLEDFVEEWEIFLGQSRGIGLDEGMMELFFNCMAFMAVYRLYDERFVTYAGREGGDVRLKLFCMDPSHLLAEACGKGRASVFFSATLLPMGYFKDILGGGGEDGAIRLTSPFERSNLCLMAAGNISTRYKDRRDSYPLIAEYIKEAVSQKTGNYLVFFPSFEYMRSVYVLYREACPEEETILQDNAMSDSDREAYLSRFEADPGKTLVAFAVMGGIFSEGIDLTGDRLSGAVIVGVGLPQLCFERDLISNHFKEKKGAGYEYAYMYPGMNRVLQAAGRVIRTEEDRGFVLLLDDRFLHRRYLELFPPEWERYTRVPGPVAVGKTMKEFWRPLG